MKKSSLTFLVVGMVCGGLCSCSDASRKEMSADFYQDLRSPKFPPPAVLEIANEEGEQKSVRRDPEGVRIRINGSESGFPPYGITPRFRVCGDFEITVSFEIVTLNKPILGYGASVSIWVMVDAPTVDAVTMARSNRPWDGNVWVADKGWWDVGEKKYHHNNHSFPTQCAAGKLRLVRIGSNVHFLAAEGDTSEFQELHQVDYKIDELTQIHLGVDTGGDKGPAEILLTDIRIRAYELPLGGINKSRIKWSWLIWLMSALFGLGIICVGLIFYWKFARRNPTL